MSLNDSLQYIIQTQALFTKLKRCDTNVVYSANNIFRPGYIDTAVVKVTAIVHYAASPIYLVFSFFCLKLRFGTFFPLCYLRYSPQGV